MLGKKVEYYECDYSEVDELIKEKYGLKGYEFCDVQETGNDVSYTFRVNGKLSEWGLREWAEIQKTGKVSHYCNGLLLNKLCQDGYIPEGEYLVKVSW